MLQGAVTDRIFPEDDIFTLSRAIGEGRYDQEKKYPIKSNQKMRYKENNSKRNTNKYIKFNNKSLTLKNIPPPGLKSN